MRARELGMEVSFLKMSYVICDEILNREQIFSDRKSNVTLKKKTKKKDDLRPL